MNGLLKSLKGFWVFTIFYLITFFTGDFVRHVITFDEDFTGPQRYFLLPVLGVCAFVVLFASWAVFYVLGDMLPSRTKQK